MSDLIGKTLGPYRVLEQIGVGGMATVYKAYQPSMDRDVAIKILPHYLSQDAEFLKRFQREARAIAKLEHAHILPVHDYGEYDGITYLVMRYVEAGTLKQRMALGPMPLDEIDRIIGQIGGALDYAHRLNVIHRDIKPGNILMDSQGDTFLTDFGLARMMEGAEQLTATGVGVGTPAYMSPEQGQGLKADRRSDIYSLGVILYEMVTGHVPFEAETPMAVVIKHITDPLPLPHTVAPDVPESIERVILKALAKDPADRFQTAGEMVQALSAAVRQASVGVTQQAVAEVTRPITVPADAPAGETPRRALAHNGLAIAGVILGLFGAIIGPGLLYSATENYLQGPLWVVAALALVAALGLGMWGLRQERSQPSRWGRVEAGFGLGLGGLAIVAFLAVGLITLAPRAVGGGLATPSPVFVTDGTLGPLLFEDNFDNGPAMRWEFDPARWEAASVDGRTVMRSDTSQSNATAFMNADNWTDYAVQFDFKFLKPDEHNASYFYLRFRTGNCPPTVPAVDNYVALISTDVIELRDESCETRVQEPVASNDRNLAGEGWHTAQVIAIGNRVQLLIDGNPVIDYTDPESPHLDGGLWLYTENKVEIAFDNFRVNEIAPGEAAALPTSSPAVVASSTPSHIQADNTIFEDDFENGLSPAWEVDPEWKVEIVDGNAVLHGAGTKDGNFAHTAVSRSDFALQTDFKFVKPSPRYGEHHIQLFVRSESCGNGILTYAVDIFPHSIALLKNECGVRGWNTLAEARREIDPAGWHTLQINVIGNRIQAGLDGEGVIDYADNDSPLVTSGRFSLITNDGNETLFDNVRATEIIPGLACAPGETKLFSDDFEDGDTTGWRIFDGQTDAIKTWPVEAAADGNHFLVGSGHQWAMPGNDKSWADYTLQMKVRAVGGSAHINIRNREGRYYILYPNGTLSRGHPGGPIVPFPLPGDDQWHSLLMRAVGAHVEVWWDQALVAEYDDPDPFLQGNVGLENLSGAVWYDDVLVCKTPAKATGN